MCVSTLNNALVTQGVRVYVCVSTLNNASVAQGCQGCVCVSTLNNDTLVAQGFAMYEMHCKLFSLLLTSTPLKPARQGLLAVLDRCGGRYSKGSR